MFPLNIGKSLLAVVCWHWKLEIYKQLFEKAGFFLPLLKTNTFFILFTLEQSWHPIAKHLCPVNQLVNSVFMAAVCELFPVTGLSTPQ